MKKIGITFLAVILALPMLLLTAPSASAATAVSIYIDGARLSTDQAPVSVQGRVLLPLRAIFEGLGSTVDWNQSTQTVTATKSNTTVVLKMKSRTATINGQTVSLDVPAQAIGGRTMVPVRFVSEALGATVNWNSAAKSVTIFSGSDGTDTTSLKAAQYVTLRDVANTGDGRDLQVSFSRSTTETLVDHYRLLMVKVSNASAFNLNAALKVGSANYTTVYPSNIDPSITLSSTARDVDGALIQPNQAYVGYVLTVGKGNNGSALSLVSSALTLDTGVTVSAVSNVRITDISDYGDGRDAAVTFTRASNESNISQYRVFLVKTKDASSFSLSRANSLSNQYYTVVSKTSSSSSTLTGTLSASSRDTAGDLIKNGVAYTAFVLSASNTSTASNKLSTASPSVTLAAGTVAAPVITQVQDLSDYGDGRDLRVSFTKIADESKISGYRIFVIKANDYSNFTLARANAISSSNYTEVSKNGYNQNPNLPAGARDVDGAAIRNGVNYRVFVMAVGSGAYSGSNALSSVSSLITLANNYSVGTVSSLYASDVNDYNDGRDLFVSYTRASDESNISHYRIMVVKAANANSFTVSKATNVSSNNYIQATVGRDYRDSLPSGARDVDGAKIQNGVSYRVFVLSVGKGSYAGQYSLSEASSTVVLTSNFSVGAVSGLTATDISDFGNGRDLRVQFYRATEESNISQYRIMVVKAANANSFTVSRAANVANGNYVQATVGWDYRDVLPSGARDVDGDRIQNGVSYRVFVLSVGKGSYAGQYSLSDASSTVVLTSNLSVGAVTSLVATDVGDAGNGNDLQIRFNRATDESNIGEYRVFVVKNGTLNEASAIINQNYNFVSKSGSGNPIMTVLANGRDTDGNAIQNGTYQVYVLSVGIDNYAGRYALSAQASVTLEDKSLLQPVSSINVEPEANARKIKVNFDVPGNGTNVLDYRIIVVPSGRNLTLEDAFSGTIPFTSVASPNQSVEISKDASGADIVSGQYQVYVLSVGTNGKASVLSGPSNSFTITLPDPSAPSGSNSENLETPATS